MQTSASGTAMHPGASIKLAHYPGCSSLDRQSPIGYFLPTMREIVTLPAFDAWLHGLKHRRASALNRPAHRSYACREFR